MFQSCDQPTVPIPENVTIEVHGQMFQSCDQSEARLAAFKSPSKLGTHLSTHCSCWNEQENGDYKTELAAGTSVELKQEPALITDPNSDLDTLRENCGIIRKQASTDGGVLWKVMCVDVVQVR
ncbi:hypothetical protein TNCV_4387561 [Trichonephila clavipes]|nr:hypothetical protein TNCV_4387561 [Trichonephila clavipes]